MTPIRLRWRVLAWVALACIRAAKRIGLVKPLTEGEREYYRFTTRSMRKR